ncbi:Ketose-bisphosphate aldolase, class-II [Niveomyces insectorum RCEF 264]|uniref:Fructose-bisphosphate aldolase n=1 Tax=Niveomyces insectorum RCEF 264 TaxID=1081102 RepID=A0A167Z987_9HYPO|nr:Ketose-bisphosphate aldolase, class-II [Niveomyces insectorum RCEF 264]
MSWKESNKTYQILKAAEEGGYGVAAPIAYNLEHIVAFVRAAEAKRSPLIIQFFPWAITTTDGLLVRAAAEAARRASVPVAVHLDHAQDDALIRHAADHLPFDSIMVDMSHYDDAENLQRTRELVAYCHARQITTEAEPGRIEGGEDGVADTVDLQGVMTTEQQIADFLATGIDFLAPAFGNIHGEYGPAGPALDYGRLQAVTAGIAKRARVVLHGTNGFSDAELQRCIAGGVSKVNINRLMLDDYLTFQKNEAAGLQLTTLVERGIAVTQALAESQMDVIGSSGKAPKAGKA